MTIDAHERKLRGRPYVGQNQEEGPRMSNGYIQVAGNGANSPRSGKAPWYRLSLSRRIREQNKSVLARV
jgi:hypothetical protein